MIFDNLDYLRDGNERQKEAYRILTANNIFEKLKRFSPILTGTIPLNIDIEESDLDIACYWRDKDNFIDVIRTEFYKQANFAFSQKVINNQETILTNFSLGEFKIEIFAQNRPTKEQEAFRHMLIEYEILEAKGENFRQDIIRLKRQGLKTEPAFAKLLGLSGNPYEALLSFKINNESAV
jgi:hypothetical protein